MERDISSKVGHCCDFCNLSVPLLSRGKVAHPQKEPNLDDSMKSLDLSISMKSLDLSVEDFPPSLATSVRPMNPTLSKPTTPRLSVVPLPTPTVTAVTPSQPAAEVHKPPTKPLRPLTAYQMFLQLEKESIIQTMAGEEDTDKSHIHEDKVYLDYVPERYGTDRSSCLPNGTLVLGSAVRSAGIGRHSMGMGR